MGSGLSVPGAGMDRRAAPAPTPGPALPAARRESADGGSPARARGSGRPDRRDGRSYALKILHLSKFYPPDQGGLEHVVACLAEGAAAAGHEVRVVSATGSSWLRPPGRRVTEPPRNGVTIDRIPTHGIVWSQPIAPGYLT